jgi:hypothetical protein
MRSFSRRLGYLHESKNAQKIVGEWLKPGGLLGDILSLSELKREMLENIAPVNQGAALNALLRAADSPNFSTISHESRLSLTRLLRSLAYDEELFDEAATALTKFALEEADNHRSNSIRNVLQSLFHSHLSGTLALPSQRSAFTRKLAFSDDSRLAKLALILLQAGLESNHFSSDYGFDFGALKRGYGWHPRTAGEIYEWYSLFIRIAVDIGKSGTAIASNARSILGASFRDLWTEARMEEALTDAARDFASIDGWPDGWIGIRNTLHWDKKRISAESLAKLKMLEVELAPKDLRAKIHAKVLSRGSYGADLDEFDSDSPMASYEKAQEEARTLGRAAAQDAGSLADLTPFLLNGDTSNKVWNFGVGVGETSTSPSGVIDQLEVLIKQPDAAGFDLQFIHGLIAGWQKSKPEEVAIFLDEAVEDPVWSALFPYLQSSVELEARGHARLIRSLEFGHAPRLHYTCFGSGRRTASLDVTQISTFLSLLATKADGGLIAAIDVLAMVIHGTDLKDEQYKADLRSYCLGFIGDLDWNSVDFANENFLYHLERIIKFALGHANPCGVVNKTLNRLLGQERAREQMFPRRLGQVLLPFFEKCPVEALNVFYDKDDHALTMRMLTMRLNRHGDTAISVVPEDVLLDWCKVSPEDRTVFAAESCTIFERSKSEPISDEITIGISSVARNVLKSAPNKRKILEIFARRFAPRSWSGSIAAIMRQRFQYLDELKPENDEELTRLVDEIKGRLSRIIAAEEKLEQEEERSGTASFE